MKVPQQHLYLAAILAVAFVVRTVNIGFPVAGYQAWRQADTASIARNFYEHGFQFASPEVDWGGGGPVECEFPIFPFVVSLLYAILSVSDTIGRFVSVAASLLTIIGLYRLVRLVLNERLALLSAGIYAVLPLNIFYGRAFMPEATMLMCSVWGIYFVARWLRDETPSSYVLAIVFLSLAALIKIVALYLGLPVLFLAWNKFRTGTFRQWRLWIMAFAILLAVFAWYYHAHQIFRESGLTFSIWNYGSDKWGIWQPLTTIKWYNDVFFKSIAERHLTYPGFFLFLYGLFRKRRLPGERLFDYWLLAVTLYFFIVSVGNQVHEYYQLPFTLPAVVFMAKAVDAALPAPAANAVSRGAKLRKAFVATCVVALPVLSFLRVSHYYQGERTDNDLFHLGEGVQRVTSAGDRVLVVDISDPVYLYRSHRKGWHASPCTISPAECMVKARLGAQYVIGTKSLFRENECVGNMQTLISTFEVVADTADYFILKLP